jgi:hypothetical protein
MTTSARYVRNAAFALGCVGAIGLSHTANADTILGTAENFAVLGASTLTNTDATTIYGNVGVNPGSAITGAGTISLTGTAYAADAVASQAQSDETNAYNILAKLPSTGNLTGENLGGQTLTAGVYSFSTSAQLTGTLTLPHAAERHGDRLVRSRPRQHRCTGTRSPARPRAAPAPASAGRCRALAPHLLDADAAPFGLRLRRALGHCRSHPAGQHRVGCDSERPCVLGDRACEPDNPMLGGGVRAAGAFRLLAGGRTGEYEPAEAALAHAAYRQSRELERTVEVDAHRLAPDLGILLPDEPLVGRADAVVHDQHVDRSQSPLGLGNGQGAALGGAEVGRDVFEARRPPVPSRCATRSSRALPLPTAAAPPRARSPGRRP